jgi:type II secretory pathway component GspD/PulD (secretin)
MPVSDFIRVLSAKYGAAVVFDDQLDSRRISAELQNTPLVDVFGLLSRRLGVQVSRVGDAWFVGKLRVEDKGFLVRKVRRLTDQGLNQAVQVLLSEAGRSVSYNDGLVVVSDRVEVLQRVSGLLDAIESARADTWVIQLYLVAVSDDVKATFGADTTALANLSYSFAKASAGLPISSTPGGGSLTSSLSAALSTTASKASVRLVGKPLFLIGDGESANFQSGVTVPVPKKTVSDQGTVTTSGFDYIQAGLSASCSLRETTSAGAKLTVGVSIGQITGYVENAPVQTKSTFNTVAVVQAGGVYLLGSLDQDEKDINDKGLTPRLLLLKDHEGKRANVEVWARVFRIAGPCEEKAQKNLMECSAHIPEPK